MRKNNYLKTSPLFYFLFLLGLIMTGCGIQKETRLTPSQESRDSFSVQSKSAEGPIVTWGGFSEGYSPGEEVTFDLAVENQTDQHLEGRYCLQLLARQSHQIIASLEQKLFSLEPGVGFSDSLNVQLPENLENGSYGLSLVVRWPGHPFVDLVQIRVGETDETRRTTTQNDLDAALAACPPVEKAGEPGYLVQKAKTDLVQRIDCCYDQIDVKSIEPVSFPDASLGVPEPGKSYAQIITPGYVIELVVADNIYVFHASQDRVVFVSGDTDQVQSNQITIRGVQVSASEIIVRGNSTLPADTCVKTELWADGEQKAWWPTETCALVRNGEWQITVSLEAENKLHAGVQYILRAFMVDGPDIVSTFSFDLDGPPTPSP